MKEGDIFESLLDGTEYVVKNIVNKMVVLQSTKEDRQILTGVETLKTKSFYRQRRRGLTDDDCTGVFASS